MKCTVAKLENGKGYICSVCSSHKAYRPGAFDFLAAYVVLEDVWYIIPAKLICGLKSISLCTEGSEGKYEEYREAWHLLREASGSEESSEDPLLATSARSGAPTESIESAAGENGASPGPFDSTEGQNGEHAGMPTGPAVVRMQNAFNFMRRHFERTGVVPQKLPSDVDPSG